MGRRGWGIVLVCLGVVCVALIATGTVVWTTPVEEEPSRVETALTLFDRILGRTAIVGLVALGSLMVGGALLLGGGSRERAGLGRAPSGSAGRPPGSGEPGAAPARPRGPAKRGFPRRPP
jgi:hypothetical protein